MIPWTLDARARDLGGFAVRRVLPAAGRRMVGPFIFFDHMGPARFAPGTGMDVRPHPHIGLATVTYLFEGEIVHRDSLGCTQAIRPGDINWMTAGRGIAHSERTGAELRAAGSTLHGLQLWVALPDAHEETEPCFHHHPSASFPELTPGPGARLRVLAGHGFGATSPVRTFSPLWYVDVALDAGASIDVPPEHEERALYLVDGALEVAGQPATPGHMHGLAPGATVPVRATAPSRAVLIGGAPVGPREIFWNFVSSSKARIEQAKQDWVARRFADVVGDAEERIPLPD